MKVGQLKSVLALNERIFLIALWLQSVTILLSCLIAFGVWHEMGKRAESSVIGAAFLNHEAALSEAVYIREVTGQRVENEFEPIRKFRNQIQANGILAEIKVTACDLSEVNGQFRLRIGQRSLEHCILVTRSQISYFRGFLGLTALSVFSVLFSWLVWAGIRKRVFTSVLRPLIAGIEEAARAEAFSELARQVAHDIRSPVAALNIVTQNLEGVDPDIREIALSASGRIREICDDLLIRASQGIPSESDPRYACIARRHVSAEDIQSAINEIVSEKKLIYHARETLEFQTVIKGSVVHSAVEMSIESFKRIVSNLVENAIDAIDDVGSITVSIEMLEQELCLRISDNGKGIPKEAMALLGTQGASFGKSYGNGLGLYHAKRLMESWGGLCDIQSVIGVGTCVSLTLPLVSAVPVATPEGRDSLLGCEAQSLS